MEATIHAPFTTPNPFAVSVRHRRHRSSGQVLPIDRIPNELLSGIFEIVTHSFDDPGESLSTPTTLSLVCSRWRQIAISTPELWTTIFLTQALSPHDIARTSTWLERSKTRPLDLYLDFRDPCWSWDEEDHSFTWNDMAEILQLLLPHISRWRLVDLLTDTWAPVFAFLYDVHRAEHAPILTTISLSRCNAFFARVGEVFVPAALKVPIPLFRGCLPSLQKLVLAGVHVDWANSGLRGLKELELKYHALDVMPSLQEFTRIITACPDLESLSILGWGPRFEDISNRVNGDVRHVSQTDNSPVNSLPRLTCFKIGFLDVDYVLKMLSLFHLPALRDLFVQDIAVGLDPTDVQDASSVLQFLSNASSLSASAATDRPYYPLSHIDSFDLHSVHASHSSLSKFFRSCPRIQNLTLACVDVVAIQALGPPTSPTTDISHSTRNSPLKKIIPCPSLVKMECRGVDLSVLIDMVISRAEAFAPLPSPLANLIIDHRGDSSYLGIGDGIFRALALVGTHLEVLVDSEVESKSRSRRGSLTCPDDDYLPVPGGPYNSTVQ
ncbi:hypothetical protein JAAARDRAFT_205618 [Jaapia argillacea MUCL 33604]|uniref:F-box domain-containing protein n=1 Tax=Jaapia argillacea MUCL 33604 TaxID=933084 RepID=A0A067Q7W9_9AGAM|nr:hypothetical protein JAAARDRAFT_205618 [Jaapia argillacea MUCL 33604]